MRILKKPSKEQILLSPVVASSFFVSGKAFESGNSGGGSLTLFAGTIALCALLTGRPIGEIRQAYQGSDPESQTETN